MGRTREFDEQVALASATRLFWERGYEATSMSMLLRGMALSKSSFYRTFDSKDALFERCLTAYADELVGAMRRSLDEADGGLAFIREILVGVAEDAATPETRHGCLVMNTANEFGQRQPSLAKLVTLHARRFEDVFYRALQRAEAEEHWTPPRSRRATARYLVSALSGLKTMAKAGATQAELRETAKLAMRALA